MDDERFCHSNDHLLIEGLIERRANICQARSDGIIGEIGAAYYDATGKEAP